MSNNIIDGALCAFRDAWHMVNNNKKDKHEHTNHNSNH